MSLSQLPETVEQAIGPAAARDLEEWLERRYGQPPGLNRFPVSSFVARQKINVLMLTKVSNLLMADEPELVLREDERQVWRVPIWLTLGRKGRIAIVGALDVDVQLGEIAFTEEDLARIAGEAKRLAEGALS